VRERLQRRHLLRQVPAHLRGAGARARGRAGAGAAWRVSCPTLAVRSGLEGPCQLIAIASNPPIPPPHLPQRHLQHVELKRQVQVGVGAVKPAAAAAAGRRAAARRAAAAAAAAAAPPAAAAAEAVGRRLLPLRRLLRGAVPDDPPQVLNKALRDLALFKVQRDEHLMTLRGRRAPRGGGV
jgi:hypothetical protein